MTKIVLSLALLSFVSSAAAVDRAQLNERLDSLTAHFQTLQQQAGGKRIPPEVLRKAKGIVLLNRTKAGFLFAYEGGSGVALVRDPGSGQWSPPAFVKANQASLGFQIGGEQNFVVILLMNTNATKMLTEPNYNVSGEARGTAGNESSGVEGKIASNQQAVRIYSYRNGLFGGAAIKGGAISPDEDANQAYYRKYVTMQDILFGGKVKPTRTAGQLISTIQKYSKG